VSGSKPLELLLAGELGQALGLSQDAVRQREQARELFSVQMGSRNRGREYPAFQAWDGIKGEPLVAVLRMLKELGGAAAYMFFAARNHELAGLTPVEVLLGDLTRPRPLPSEAVMLLNAEAQERLDATLAAAEAFYADATA
jgi:hypothetical protein